MTHDHSSEPDDGPLVVGAPRSVSELREAREAAKIAVTSARKPKKTGRSKARIVFGVSQEEELSSNTLKLRDRSQTTKLRWVLAIFAISAVSVQIVVANLLFGAYMFGLTPGATDSAVMIAWMSATVVEVIGIVVIVARNLFPSASKKLSRADVKKIVLAIAER